MSAPSAVTNKPNHTNRYIALGLIAITVLVIFVALGTMMSISASTAQSQNNPALKEHTENNLTPKGYIDSPTCSRTATPPSLE
ncbi:MAG: hypothetical protein NWE92_11590 [Candidatus Bathyarchaeota archaeon]|nr:hypothetical protein [Candidatus Bathyarchaeota archaeon]